jgi:hypothetical protein
MQFMGSGIRQTIAFSIALPAITLITALLVFNLQMLLDGFSAISEQSTGWLRSNMKAHRRLGWKSRAIALQEDRIMRRAPVRRARRQASGWVYAMFVLEFILTTIPVAEIIEFLKFIRVYRDPGSRPSSSGQRRPSNAMLESGVEGTDPNASSGKKISERIREKIELSIEEEKRRAQEQKDNERGPLVAAFRRGKRSASIRTKMVLRFVLSVIRSIFVPIWLILLLVEFVGLTFIFVVRRTPTVAPQDQNPLLGLSGSVKQKRKSPGAHAYEVLGLDAIHPLRSTKQPVTLNRQEVKAVTRAATFFNSRTTTPQIGTLSSNGRSNTGVSRIGRTQSDDATLSPKGDDEEEVAAFT